MPELDEISYSRDATVGAVRDYYAFLTKMYLNEDIVITPPEAGWPSITGADENLLAGLGKTDEVVGLLAHLPYIKADGDANHRAHGAPDCYFADWRALIRGLDEDKSNCDGLKIITEGYDFYEDAPPHVIGLTAGAYNPLFVLDTELGIVHWSDDCPGEIKLNPSREPVKDDPYEYAPENEADWRNDAPAWAIADFFELLKDQFRQLKFIPISPHTVTDVYIQGRRSEGMIPMLQEIYHEHGWPDLERYRKRECLDAIQKALEERYPDEADYRRS
ncbi:hypothetical protein F4819DRAFT_237305 [Hypoxylon fuscum]|nr:hypothetical protein F4819DRAFT_237305 [Hypoxylon fuscum]